MTRPSSTVVRFVQALGFEGVPELQAAARDEYRRYSEAKTPARAPPRERVVLTSRTR